MYVYASVKLGFKILTVQTRFRVFNNLLRRMAGRPKRKAVEDTEKKAKKARGETDLGFGLKWQDEGAQIKGIYPLLTLTSTELPGYSKVAAFDVDCTIIKTASGRTFAIGSNDWVFWDEQVPAKLKELHKDGFGIFFFTNQAGIEKGKVSPQSFRDKMEDIIKQLAIPVQVFASTGTTHYRKPSPAMWDFFVKNDNKGIEVDKTESIYVGDAAGRPKGWAKDKPKDFSCGDRMFAANIGLKFATPDEFFLNEKSVPFEWRALDPAQFLKSTPAVSASSDKSTYANKAKEVVVMVGQPASGKSTFRRWYLEPHGYVAVNRDTLGTIAKCLKAAKDALGAGKSVVVDNTNPSVQARSDFIKLAQSSGVSCRCVWMQTSFELSHHLNMVRQNQTKGETRRVPGVGFNMFKKNFEEPTAAEGFTGGIMKMEFKPRFDSKNDELLFRQWTVPE